MPASVVNSTLIGRDSDSGETAAFDVGSGANRVLVAILVNDEGGTFGAPTYNGVTMTQFINFNGSFTRLQAFVLVAPATGSNTFAWTGIGDHGVVLIAYEDADQADPVPNTASGNGSASSGSLNVTTSVDEMLLGLVVAFDNAGDAFSASGGSTELQDGVFGSGAGDYRGGAFSKAAASAGVNNIAWSNAGDEAFSQIAWAVRPAGVADAEVNVNDSITVAESITVDLVTPDADANIDVFDGVTVAESVNVTLAHNVHAGLYTGVLVKPQNP